MGLRLYNTARNYSVVFLQLNTKKYTGLSVMNKTNVMVQNKDNQPNVTQLNKEMVCLHNNNKYKEEISIVAKRIII